MNEVTSLFKKQFKSLENQENSILSLYSFPFFFIFPLKNTQSAFFAIISERRNNSRSCFLVFFIISESSQQKKTKNSSLGDNIQPI